MSEYIASLREQISATRGHLRQLESALLVAESEEAETARAKRELANLDIRLLRLPPELRNRVYEMLVPCRYWRTLDKERRQAIAMAPLQTCRAMRKDLVPMQFGIGVFSISMSFGNGRKDAWQWLQSLGVDSVAAIRRLQLSTSIICPCVVSNSEARRRSWIGLDVSINLLTNDEPRSVLDRICQNKVIERQDLATLLEIMQSPGKYKLRFAS